MLKFINTMRTEKRFAQNYKSYRNEVRTYKLNYNTDKLMFGYVEKLKLHLLNKYKTEKRYTRLQKVNDKAAWLKNRVS